MEGLSIEKSKYDMREFMMIVEGRDWIGKNLGRIAFKSFFDRVMAKRPRLLSASQGQGNLLESDDMILRGTLGRQGQTCIIDAWDATHATTSDNLPGDDDTYSVNFWIDDKMTMHAHVKPGSWNESSIPVAEKVAERWKIPIVYE